MIRVFLYSIANEINHMISCSCIHIILQYDITTGSVSNKKIEKK
jgi:hypothetical protein